MTLRLITAPLFSPVTLAEIKSFAKIDTDDDDDMLTGIYLPAVLEHLTNPQGGWLGLSFCTRTLELVLDRFPGGSIKLPYPPIQSVESVKYDDVDGVEQTVDPANYTLDNVDDLAPGWVVPLRTYAWPDVFDSINTVRVRFIAGWATDGGSPETALVPANLKLGILSMISDSYQQRESFINGTISTPVIHTMATDRLLNPFRSEWLG